MNRAPIKQALRSALQQGDLKTLLTLLAPHTKAFDLTPKEHITVLCCHNFFTGQVMLQPENLAALLSETLAITARVVSTRPVNLLTTLPQHKTVN
jgi:hypothetical protein